MPIGLDMSKAKDIHRDNVRAARKPCWKQKILSSPVLKKPVLTPLQSLPLSKHCVMHLLLLPSMLQPQLMN